MSRMIAVESERVDIETLRNEYRPKLYGIYHIFNQTINAVV